MQQRAALGIGLALAATVFYGQVPVLTRLAFNHGIPAIETILLRTFVVATLFAAVAAMRREAFGVPRAAWPSFLWQCVATFAVSSCYLISLQFIPVSLAVIIFFAFPIIVLVASPVVEGHAPDVWRIGVAVLAFAGIAIAIGTEFSSLNPLGLLLAALSAIGCALQFFSGRSLSQHLSPVVTSSLVHLAVLPLILALALILQQGSFASFSANASGVGLIAMMCVSVAYLAGYFLHMSSVSSAPASTVVPFFNLEPVISTVMAALVLREHIAVNQLIGGGIVLVALVLCGIIEKTAKSQ